MVLEALDGIHLLVYNQQAVISLVISNNKINDTKRP